MKKRIWLLLCLFILSGCSPSIQDGVAYELYVDSSASETASSNYTLYHMQNKKIYEVGRYMPCYEGGTPRHIRDKVGKYFGTDGRGMYDQGYGQLDDYYIDENIEAYLYVQADSLNLMYFEKGIQQNIELPDNSDFYRQMQYCNGYIYLIGFFDQKSEYSECTVMKINTQTKRVESLKYRRPIYESVIEYANDESRIIIEGDMLISHYTVLDDLPKSKEMICLSSPDGKYREIEAMDPDKNYIPLVFETPQGFAMLETVDNVEKLSESDFFMLLRYFDTEGQEILQKQIDCSKVLNKVRKPTYVNDGAQYYNEKLYFATYADGKSYLFEYHIPDQVMTYCGNVPGIAEEAQIIEYRNGIPYSLS